IVDTSKKVDIRSHRDAKTAMHSCVLLGSRSAELRFGPSGSLAGEMSMLRISGGKLSLRSDRWGAAERQLASTCSEWDGGRTAVKPRPRGDRAGRGVREDQSPGGQFMIEMSCPRCGAGGRVPRERVNSRLVCRKCLQVFHLSPSLQPVI